MAIFLKRRVFGIAVLHVLLFIGILTYVMHLTENDEDTLIHDRQTIERFNRLNVTSGSIPRVLVVDAGGNFTRRVAEFNVFLNDLRTRRFANSLRHRQWVRPRSRVEIIYGFRDDYIVQLHRHPGVTTVVLPWLETIGGPPGAAAWSSLRDPSNVLLQTYHEWTADDPLCAWIETDGAIKLKYDAIYNRTCVRKINETAKRASLKPTFLNGKPLNRRQYWPNDGKSFPNHFYTDPPPIVSHVHIIPDGFVTELGDVYSGNFKLLLYGCGFDTDPSLPLDGKLLEDDVPLYKEVFVISQYWGTAVFHRMAEVVPRLAFVLGFLRANPQIRIVASEGPESRLGELVRVLGLDPSRLVTGAARAKVVYQPRASGCGVANVQESQIVGSVYRDYIRRNLDGEQPPSPRRRSIVLIRRSGTRRFAEQFAIERLAHQAANDYDLRLVIFDDNPTPSLEQTMRIFNSAVAVVAPCGAGLSNVYFSEPGTFVVEGVCNLPHVNLCFLRLSHILGHHWHGVPSRGGCETVVDVGAPSVARALRSHLDLWTAAAAERRRRTGTRN